MDRRGFLREAGIAGAGLMLAGRGWGGSLAGSGKKPNIVLILADDLGYADVGCFGAQLIHTPNLDKMATQGAKMTSFYSSAPVCSPSRAGLLTGRYPARTGVTEVVFPTSGIETLVNAEVLLAGGALTLPKNEITLGQALQRGGYRTCCIGKWHLGDMHGTRPWERGFDHYLGVLYSNDMVPLEMWRNGKIVEKAPADQDYFEQKYTAEALGFIKENKDRPFFLYFAHNVVHVPIHASPDFHRKSPAGIYGDAVQEMDWSVGKLLEALESYGLAENTLVFFTSDNGPWWNGNPGYHRGRKNEDFEGGMNVPFIARWPGQIPEGRVTGEMSMNFDLFTTCLAAAGLEPPKDRAIDGLNILPLLSGREQKSSHEELYFYHGKDLQALRVGKWKYHVRHLFLSYPAGLRKGPMLFDLEADPNESYDVRDVYPEVARDMESRIARWQKGFVKHLPHGMASGLTWGRWD